MVAREHRWAPHEKVLDYLKLGWLPLPTLEGTHHGEWSVHMVWLCDQMTNAMLDLLIGLFPFTFLWNDIKRFDVYLVTARRD